MATLKVDRLTGTATTCGIAKKSSLDYSDQDLQAAVRAILGVVT
jgi:uncharacterized metal-binding protein